MKILKVCLNQKICDSHSVHRRRCRHLSISDKSSPHFFLSFQSITVIEVTEEYLKEKLYEIRGKRVLLDADLAEIYGYDTKGFNRQVKNNIEKFDEDFMFELTDEELEDLRYKNCTAN